MVPNARWDDDALDQFERLVDVRFASHDDQLAALRALPTEMARMARAQEAFASELADFKGEVRDGFREFKRDTGTRIANAHKRIDGIAEDRAEIRKETVGRWQGRAAVVAAAIIAVGGVTVAILNLVQQALR